jgi:hypothetical protein
MGISTSTRRGRRAMISPVAVAISVSATVHRADGVSRAAACQAGSATRAPSKNRSRSSVATNSYEKNPIAMKPTQAIRSANL